MHHSLDQWEGSQCQDSPHSQPGSLPDYSTPLADPVHVCVCGGGGCILVHVISKTVGGHNH